MPRPRHETIEITAEKQMEHLRENYSRRRIVQLFGVTGAAALAGCGGGPGQETPTGTGTATEPSGGATTPTATEEEAPTATGTETATETVRTPTGEVTVTDQWFRDVTTTNFEKINPNTWNQETGFNVNYQTMWLSRIPKSYIAGSSVESLLEIFIMMAATKYELDPTNNVLTIHLHEDLSYSDGTTFDVDAVQAHLDLIKGQLGLAVGEGIGGGTGETTIPLSVDHLDEFTLEAQLLPGNPVIRAITTLFQGRFRNVGRTHPKFHGEYVEGIRDATTSQQVQGIIQELFSARFPEERLPKMSLGPWKATEWNPTRMIFEAREDFPWGLNYHPDQDRIFKGVRWTSVAEQTQSLNLAATNKISFYTSQSPTFFERLDDNWTNMGPINSPVGNVLYFSPTSKYGRKTEQARMLRHGIAYLFDSEEAAAVNELEPVYEQTTGLISESVFEQWIGEQRYLDSWTVHGHKKRGYFFEEKGFAKLREAGYERGKQGVWKNAETGTPLAPEILLEPDVLPRPTHDNIVEQFNRIGIQAKGITKEREAFENTVRSFDFDWTLIDSNYNSTPHPYIGYREDMGLGSAEGLPVGIASWDWRNGYGKVEVPMPVGNPDGQLTEFDWDTNTLEMTEMKDPEKVKRRGRTLNWVVNQWVPGVAFNQRSTYVAHNKNDVEVDTSNIAINDEGGRAIVSALPTGFWQPAN